MPTYDYECQKCQHTWELFQPITAKPVKKCPECGKSSARRVIGPGAAILFKGSGFYLTDYRSDSYKKAAEADKKSSEPAAAKDGAASKSDGAAKSEGKSGKKAESK
jgi:putative FmdB family regulatory protein